MKLDDFGKVSEVWDVIGDDLELLIPSCAKSDLINMMMILHSSSMIFESRRLVT